MTLSSMLILIGVSGCGKSTLCEVALHKFPSVKKLIAATTRPPRQCEVDGIDKHFLTQKEFDAQKAANYLCLTYEAYGYQYAFYKRDFLTGETYIGELNYNNLEDFRKYCFSVTTIYIQPRDMQLAVLGVKNRGAIGSEVSSRVERINDERLELDSLYSTGRINYKIINGYDENSKIQFESLLNTILHG